MFIFDQSSTSIVGMLTILLKSTISTVPWSFAASKLPGFSSLQGSQSHYSPCHCHSYWSFMWNDQHIVWVEFINECLRSISYSFFFTLTFQRKKAYKPLQGIGDKIYLIDFNIRKIFSSSSLIKTINYLISHLENTRNFSIW